MPMGEYASRIIEYAIPCLVLWGIFWASAALDRSRFRNCIYLLLAAASTAPFICSLSGEHFAGTAKALSLLLFLVLLSVPFILIANGVIMYKREGRSLANQLSLLLGIAVAVGEICTLLFYVFPYYWAEDTARFVTAGMKALLLISLTVTYGSLIFVGFMCYTVLLQMIPRKRDFDYIIIHGSGLIRGKEVSKLLSDRIDKAIEVYRLDPTKPIMIPAGGRGRDEEISEAEAMEGYLLAHGIPQEHIIREDRSGTTRENLIFSRKIIESREGSRYTALVTSNYHVWRALSICRDLDFECTGIGAHVAPYYWPSAVIREFVALISTKKHLLVFAAGWVLCVFPLMSRIMTAVSQ